MKENLANYNQLDDCYQLPQDEERSRHSSQEVTTEEENELEDKELGENEEVSEENDEDFSSDLPIAKINTLPN